MPIAPIANEEILLNKYRILKPLGSGALGDVYLAEDIDLKHKVAVKHLKPEYAADEEALKRFREEASTIANLRHPNIAVVHGLEQEDSQSYIVMEYAEKGKRRRSGRRHIAARLTHVQGFFQWAYIHGASPLTSEMVRGLIHKPRARQLSPHDVLDASEVEAMLKVVRSAENPTQAKREHVLIRVMADVGLRVSEAISLRAEDLYLANGKWYLFEEQRRQVQACRSVEGPGSRVAGAEGCRPCSPSQYVQENRP